MGSAVMLIIVVSIINFNIMFILIHDVVFAE